VISFNPQFTSKMRRIKVPLVAVKEVLPASSSSSSSSNNNHHHHHGDDMDGLFNTNSNNINETNLTVTIEEERRHQVEAAIVRIMKARKQMNHNDLIAETTRQLNYLFLPSLQFIKKRIESLIEREFIERHPDDSRLYNYLA
jgi:cullin 3